LASPLDDSGADQWIVPPELAATPPGSAGHVVGFDTPLSTAQEQQFQTWKQQNAPNDSGYDYDLRGAFKAGVTPDPDTGHWPDTYKKPNHPTFSNQSIYAKIRPDLAGHWEGETLVVDVTSLNDQTWFDRAGNFHSDALHVVERYTRRSADTMMYEATIEDPKVFSRPWKISMPLYKRVEKNAQLLEFKCVEFAEEMLYGHLRKRYN
jgi:hypothetical protein